MTVTDPTPVELDAPAEVPFRPKRHLWLVGLLVPLLPFIAWGLVRATGLGVFWWFGPLFVFGLGPLIDTAVGRDSSSPPEATVKALEADRYYRWVTYLYLPLQYAGLLFACHEWAAGDLSLLDRVGLAFTVAMVAGVAINTAHELGHKKDRAERRIAKVGLAQSCYGHFFIEHNRGHHVRVATPEDPASSRLGESFWTFLPRSVVGSLRSAWALEHKRLARLERGPWSLRNDVLNAWAISVVLFAALTAFFGLSIVPYLAIQAVLGFSLLEVVNYLEHYGMLRQREPSGRYERVRPAHSWNSNNTATNLALYHLQRHSDHHANPTRRYQALRDFSEAPQLPSGYATMISVALVTPLWRKVMDPKVIAHHHGDLTLANIDPRLSPRRRAHYETLAAAVTLPAAVVSERS